MNCAMTWASSPGWLKLMVWAARLMTTTSTLLPVLDASSLTRSALAIGRSRCPNHREGGEVQLSSRSNRGNWVSAWNSRDVLGCRTCLLSHPSYRSDGESGPAAY